MVRCVISVEARRSSSDRRESAAFTAGSRRFLVRPRGPTSRCGGYDFVAPDTAVQSFVALDGDMAPGAL